MIRLYILNQDKVKIKNRLRLLMLGSLALALTSGEAFAASASTNATAEVVSPIGISKDTGQDLRFGLFSSGTGGTVIMSPTGAQSVTGDVTLGQPPAVGAASFDVMGAANGTYLIALPTSETITSRATSVMTLDTFTSSLSGSGSLDASRSQTLTVGATLMVGSAQAQGSYTGTFTVTMEYN